MHRYLFPTAVSAVLAAAILAPLPLAAEVTSAERVSQSRAVIADFAKKLKGELVSAIQAGGPVTAISVCHTAAPSITKDAAAEKGWDVGRTALKLRNPANAPDPWEHAVLLFFQSKAQSGAGLAKLEHHEVMTQEDGKRVFRYMKAIPVQEPCLACHGSIVDVELRNKIQEVYPQDQATGFKLGELRGAFTITQPLE